MLPVGSILVKRFSIKSVLGSGGFGVTYLAIDDQLQKLFALKEYFPSDFASRNGTKVKPKNTSDDDFQWGLDRFLEEARVLARFNHPNIVGVNQIFEANGTAYIVLEYQSGRSLKDWLSSIDGRPTQEELDQITIPLLDALDTLHRNNILHRDIAPDNIYIRDDGSPVLLDFGSAREAIAARTKTVTAIYKEGFTPIEQYSTKGSGQGPWTDIYSVAATLYLAISGEKPPESTDRIINDEIISATSLNDGQYRKEFLEALDWALKIQPNERPQSINEWKESLIEGKSVNLDIENQKSEQENYIIQDKKIIDKKYFNVKKIVIILVIIATGGFSLEKYLVQREFEKQELIENTKKSDIKRQQDELARQAEFKRQQDELARQAEIKRQQDELARQAEFKRQQEAAARQAELKRQQDELARQAELKRQQEEAARQAEIKRQQEELQRQAYIKGQQDEAARLAYIKRQQDEEEFKRQQEEAARQAEFKRQQAKTQNIYCVNGLSNQPPDNFLVLRDQPNRNSKWSQTINFKNGDRLEVIGSYGDYYMVRASNGEIGYSGKAYIFPC